MKLWKPYIHELGQEKFQFKLQNSLLERIEINTIIDVGCHQGYTIKKFHRDYCPKKIHGFEPSSENFKILKDTVKDMDDVNVFNVAVSDVNTEMKLNLSSNSGNSLLKHKLFKKVKTETVKVVRLDTWALKNNITNLDYLKIDTQGNDFRVIKGTGDLLSTVKILKVEVWFVEDGYDDSHLFHEVMGYLHDRGLLLYNMDCLTYASNACLRWGDALFLRRDILSQIMNLKT